MAEDSEEEDYMKMTFPDPSTSSLPQKETSLQRRLRLRREAEARSRPKSKAELLAEAESRLQQTHSQSLFSPSPSSSSTTAPKSKGLKMMAKMGFTGGSLGASSSKKDGLVEPIRVEVRDGREGIGLRSEKKRKLEEAMKARDEEVKKARVDEEGYRERVRREREDARLERLVWAAMGVAETMDSESRDRKVKTVPVVYRGLVRKREEVERKAREEKMGRGVGVVQATKTGLPTFDDPDEDADDRHALGRTVDDETEEYVVEEGDDEDVELDKFNALAPDERLRRVVEYLRDRHRYCFWCKYQYPDEDMLGCPGLTEEDHD
ncbi:hypothetical protein QBC47DRAFT_376671 [Echria macrotheca]|uniref:G-patch domain-containing protein n=1 Tax=Echria macrotheca TaxID=438768 RepID=A0AAJ0BKR0_9PEZI|nr:hypothetical protein QBC47DRAFT_376671 [Echria macrotheca]